MILIDIIAELAGEQIAERSGDFVYLKTKTKVEKKLIDQAEALLDERKTEAMVKEVREERDRLIESVRWRIERHNDELALGTEPTEPLEPLLQYVQELRDVPQQAGFPESVEWPEIPSEG